MPASSSESAPPLDPSLDRGWAWVIAVAVCIINIISLGSIRCLGILVNNASLEFSINKRDSSLIFSITYVTFMLSTLTRVVSTRLLIFAGGVLTCCGLGLAYFLPSPSALASGTAVLLGLGLSASQNPAILLLNQYFDRYRSRANGIAFAGGPIGSFLMPPLLTHLMLKFTFRGAMLLWGGLTLHVCAAACLMRPKLPPPPPPLSLNSAKLPIQAPTPPSSGPAFGEGLQLLDSSGGVPYVEDDAETVWADDDNAGERGDPAEAAEERPLTPATPPPAAPTAPSEPAARGGLRSTLNAMCGLDPRLFRWVKFYAIAAVLTLGLCGLTLSFYMVPLHGRELGLDSTTTSLFLLLQGIPDLVSRLLAGFVTDKRLLSHLRLVWICLLGQSALWFILLATPSYAGLLVFATVSGLFGGVVIAETHPLAISELGLVNYRAAFAIYSILHGCWMLCLPILLGHIYDRTDSWRLAIAFVGFLLATAGLTGLLLDVSQSVRVTTHRIVGRMWRC